MGKVECLTGIVGVVNIPRNIPPIRGWIHNKGLEVYGSTDEAVRYFLNTIKSKQQLFFQLNFCIANILGDSFGGKEDKIVHLMGYHRTDFDPDFCKQNFRYQDITLVNGSPYNGTILGNNISGVLTGETTYRRMCNSFEEYTSVVPEMTSEEIEHFQQDPIWTF
jgi:hypothetical protein